MIKECVPTAGFFPVDNVRDIVQKKF